jgi:uncharacterized YceG family protein
MSWFGRRKSGPDPLEWGSSFAEAEVLSKGRGRRGNAARAYDSHHMAAKPPTDDRPIGSRRTDVPPPASFGSAPPPVRRRTFGQRVASVLLLIAAALLLGGLGYVVFGFVGGSDSEVAAGTPVKVVIPQGATSEQIADVLAEAGVVERETMFRARLKLNGDGSDFRAGTYTMKTGSSYDSIVATLEKGPAAAPTFDLTIPEGQRLEETAAFIDAQRATAQREGDKVLPAFTGAEYLKAVQALPFPAGLQVPKGTRSREGLQFPATYELRFAASAEDFAAKQREAFEQNMAEIDMTKAKAANLTPYDIVIIASLIEREARLPKERPLVSAVIWNRLKIGEPLGIDASNQYAAYEPGAEEFWVRELLQSQLDEEGPYNLRKVQGLPPTPIAAPSRASLDAAAAPADVDYRYYVANPDGSGEHFFTESYDEFLAHPFQGG